MKSIGIILARGGSKRIKNKNIIPLGNKPLISWTVDCALNSKSLDKVIVSTDSDQIADICSDGGCEVPFKRPELLASDNASAIDVVLHALEHVSDDFENFVLLQPTSPFRKPIDIDNSIKNLSEKNTDAIFSVTLCPDNPYLMFQSDNGYAKPLLNHGVELSRIRTQDMPSAYVINGAVYCANIKKFKDVKSFFTPKSRLYIMPHERSLDIDNQEDFDYAQYLVEKNDY